MKSDENCYSFTGSRSILKGIYKVSIIQDEGAKKEWGQISKKSRELIENLGIKDLIPSY
ncbi:MAG: hypothetical protein QXU98_14590 [Candidatus Parvarchaeota archaeon]